MNDDIIFGGILLASVLILGAIISGALLETIQDHEYRMAELSCNPVCRNEFGQRVECADE